MPENTKQIQVLLVDDNSGDIHLMKSAAQKFATRLQFVTASDGEQAIEMLQSSFATGRFPHMVLLDLNMPRKDGFWVLSKIRSDAALKHLPVVVLTSSKADMDVLMAYQLQANAYLTKPVELSALGEMMKSIQDFWAHNVSALDSINS